jgi:hypothetical protein
LPDGFFAPLLAAFANADAGRGIQGLALRADGAHQRRADLPCAAGDQSAKPERQRRFGPGFDVAEVWLAALWTLRPS